MLNESLGDLRAGAVASTQEEEARSRPSPLNLLWWRRHERKPGMERKTGFAEKVTAPEEISSVIHVASVGGAAAGAHDAPITKLPEVVGDKVLRLAHEFHELADTTVAATELDDQLPPQRIAEQPEDLGRLRFGHADI